MRQLKLGKAFTLMESGPVVLVTTHDGEKDNIMTISWTMVMDFTPVFAITTGEWNHSFKALRKNRECVIAIPTVDMLDKVVDMLRDRHGQVCQVQAHSCSWQGRQAALDQGVLRQH
jgi:flavin reductase (DIM6/NTAB) family NADH-FMN oxidoreductase RutF